MPENAMPRLGYTDSRNTGCTCCGQPSPHLWYPRDLLGFLWDRPCVQHHLNNDDHFKADVPGTSSRRRTANPFDLNGAVRARLYRLSNLNRIAGHVFHGDILF